MEQLPEPDVNTAEADPDEDIPAGKQGDGFDAPFSDELTEADLHSVRTEQIRLTDEQRDPFDRRRTAGRRQTDANKDKLSGEDQRHVPSWERETVEPTLFLASHAVKEVVKRPRPAEKPDPDTLFLAEGLGVMAAFEHLDPHHNPDVDPY